MVGDLSINSFDYDNNALAKNFFNLIFQSGFLSLIQRATRAKRITTAIDHIINDAILESIMHSRIIKANISDYFPIFAFLGSKASTEIKIMEKKQNNQSRFQ